LIQQGRSGGRRERGGVRPQIIHQTSIATFVEKIRNLYCFHLRMRCPSPRPLQDLLREIPPKFPPPNGVELAIDVDPIGML
jgi:primosomal protein N'